jgi:hypothetical protein
MMLRPFFPYYGSKWRIARKYPAPTYQQIIEPFAGSACYSLAHHQKSVTLMDAYDVVAGLWGYLIRVSPGEIMGIPMVRDISEISAYPQEARWLVGFWLNPGSAVPGTKGSKWVEQGQGWRPSVRERIAQQVDLIRHWKVIHGSYSDSGNEHATWFVDPPYECKGRFYKHSEVDYRHLGEWAMQRNGQTIVCENEGAGWLPFSRLCEALSSPGKHRPVKKATEVMWTNIR